MAGLTGIRVPPEKVADIWPHVKHLVYRAMKRADLTLFGPVEEGVLNGSYALWVAFDDRVRGAAVTQIVRTENNRRVLHICAYGGSMKVAQEFLGHIEDYGREQGCVASRITGRIGWEKIFPQYRRRRVILEKALLNG